MALVAETAASAVISQLVDKVLEYANMSWWPSARSVKAEAEKLQDKLPQIRLVLAAVQGDKIKQRNPDFDARLWQFRDAIEAADDVLDEIKYYELEEKIKERDNKVSGPLSGYKRKLVDFVKNSFVNDGVLNKLREAVKGLEAIASDSGLILQIANSLEQKVVVNNFRETGSFLTENTVIGREKEKEEIVEWLIAQPDGHEQGLISFFSIFGVGGMGKTTLTQLVCKEQRVIENFKPIVWICVSDNSEIVHAKTIIKKIIEDISGERCDLDNLNTLQNKLKEKIKSKKFLLVLDDVWRDDTLLEWEKIIAPLRFGERGSKILLTTRMKSVAEMVAGVMEGENKLKNLAGLEEKDFMDLFYRHAFAGTDPNKHQYLHEIGKQIAKTLWACPLAAKVIGGVLNKSLKIGFWTKILKKDILNIELSDGNIMDILKLSYYHLPTHLQLCFRYCSIFPQDHRIEKEELVKMWMGSGLIPQHENEKRRPEDVGEEYLDQLTRKSFFYMKPNYSYDGFHYFIHDLLHDLAQCVSRGECLRITDNAVAIPRTIRHLSIEMKNNSTTFPKIRNVNKLQTLVITCIFHDLDLEQILNKIVPEMKSLRLLRIVSKTVQKIPTTIGDLIHLRYLSITSRFFTISTEVIWSPKSLWKLYHLQVIDLYGNISTSELEGMCNLINLRYYRDVDYLFPQIAGIGNLISLQELNYFDAHLESGSVIRKLKHLTGLRKLCICDLNDVRNPDDAVEAEINKKENLNSLDLNWSSYCFKVRDRDEEVADNLKPHANLNKLSISYYSGIRSPCWMNDNFYCNLTDVKLSSCYRWEHLPPLGQLNSLESLELREMYAVKQVGYSLYGNSSDCVFPSLRQLKFEYMPEWDEWIGVADKAFPCLEKLVIEKCPKLRRFPTGSHLFPSLKQLEFNEMLELEEWTGLVDDLLFPYLDKLFVIKCPKLKRFPSGSHLFPSLRVLVFNEMLGMEEWNGLDDELLFPCLEKLVIEKCPKLRRFPTGSHLFPSLKQLEFNEMLELEEWTGLDDELLFPCLDELIIRKCPKLKRIPTLLPSSLRCLEITDTALDALPLFHQTPRDSTVGTSVVTLGLSLSKLLISCCPNIVTLVGSQLLQQPEDFSALDILSIKECRNLLHMPMEFVIQLVSLTDLTIMNCPKLTACEMQLHIPTMLGRLEFGLCGDLEPLLTRALHNLTSLTSLGLYHCASIQSLPPKEVLARMTCLHSLSVTSCKELTSLNGLEVLTKLESLCIIGCEKLIGVSLQQQPLLSHNNQVDLVRNNLKVDNLEIDHSSLLLLEPLRSLKFTKNFKIRDNPQITSLPGQWLEQNRLSLESISVHEVSSLQSLPSSMENMCTLQNLHISGCKMLKSLPNLPPSLLRLRLAKCHPELADLCKREAGLYWSMISHIPNMYIDAYVEPASPP